MCVYVTHSSYSSPKIYSWKYRSNRTGLFATDHTARQYSQQRSCSSCHVKKVYSYVVSQNYIWLQFRQHHFGHLVGIDRKQTKVFRITKLRLTICNLNSHNNLQTSQRRRDQWQDRKGHRTKLDMYATQNGHLTIIRKNIVLFLIPLSRQKISGLLCTVLLHTLAPNKKQWATSK